MIEAFAIFVSPFISIPLVCVHFFLSLFCISSPMFSHHIVDLPSSSIVFNMFIGNSVTKASVRTVYHIIVLISFLWPKGRKWCVIFFLVQTYLVNTTSVCDWILLNENRTVLVALLVMWCLNGLTCEHSVFCFSPHAVQLYMQELNKQREMLYTVELVCHTLTCAVMLTTTWHMSCHPL